MVGGTGDVELSTYGGHVDGGVVLQCFKDRELLIIECFGPSTTSTSCLGRLQTSTCVLPKIVHKVVVQCSEHVECETAYGSCGVDGVRKADEVRSFGLDRLHHFDEVPHLPRQSAELVNHHDIPRPKLFKQLSQLLAAFVPATGLFLVDPLATRRSQRIDLKVEVLVIGGDAAVSDFHALFYAINATATKIATLWFRHGF